MIIGHRSNIALYATLHSKLGRALEYLAKTDIGRSRPGAPTSTARISIVS